MRPSSPVRIAAATLVAAAALAACGSSGPAKPSEAALAAKLKSESELQSFSDAQIDCVAAVVRQYGDASALDQYVAGRITAEQLTGSDESVVQAKLDTCLRGTGASG